MSGNRKKVTVGFFDFSGCEGCQIELTNLGAPIFSGLLEHIEFVEFREVMTEQARGMMDIAFIEGSFTRELDRARLEDIRARAKLVVAYGACAVSGGINALKNHTHDFARFVYGKDAGMPHLESQAALPISAAIRVDYQIPGCPIDKDEFYHVVSHLLHGKEPVIPNHPVCVECKMRETVCRYHRGDHCLGPVARAGCGAPCPADGIPCEACRGFVDHPNEDSMVKALVLRGHLPEDRARTKSRLFTANLRSDAK